MHRLVAIFFGLALAALSGCSNASTRIRQQPELFNSLEPAIREKVARGEVEPGYTTELVRLALGEPSEVTAPDAGTSVWVYRNLHRDRKDLIRNGYRRRIVFDPVLRAETVIVEPIDDRMADKIAPHSRRLTFRDGRLIAIERVPEM